MTIKQFVAATAHEAMQEVRTAFGRDAIIISNRQTADGIEIVATDNLDDLQSAQTNTERQSGAASNAASNVAQNIVRSNGADHSSSARAKQGAKTEDDDRVRQSAVLEKQTIAFRENMLRQEIADLQGAVQGLATSGSVANGAHWSEITLAGRLTGLGLGASLVQQLVEQAKPIVKVDAAWSKTLKNMQKYLRFTPGDFISEGGVIFFHGPPGAGKTTAICKLATQFLHQNTVGKLAVVSATGAAGIESKDGLLRAFSQLVKVPVHSVESTRELADVIKGLRRKKLVLVDTPSFDANNLLPVAEYTSEFRGKNKIEHCLVVSACSQGSLLDHTFGCLAESAIESVVLTQLDQTRQIGTAIDSLLRSGLQLRYCGDSREIEQPLRENAGEVLIQKLAEGSLSPQTRFAGKTSSSKEYDNVANWLESAIIG